MYHPGDPLYIPLLVVFNLFMAGFGLILFGLMAMELWPQQAGKFLDGACKFSDDENETIEPNDKND